MTDLTCTGWMRDEFNDLEWSHWMFCCDTDCPMEIDRNRRHAEAMQHKAGA